MDTRDFKLGDEYKVLTNSGSKGCQLKYYKDGLWFKVNTSGYEGLAELVSSYFLCHSNNPDFISYELCSVNGRPGCYSHNFLGKNEELLSFDRFHFIRTGKSLSAVTALMDNADSRYHYVVDFFMKEAALDIQSYLDAIISLDFLTRNGDRHYNNLAVIKTGSGYKNAPIFDNGDAFFSSYSKFDPWMSITECIEKSVACPFSGSFELQFNLVKKRLKINYKQLLPKLYALPDSRCRTAALYLLDKYENLYRDDSV
jgi:hypothetical protein